MSATPVHHPPIADLRAAFAVVAKPGTQDWPTLADFTAFAAAGRTCGRAPLVGLPGWTCEDAARVLALVELAGRTPESDLSARLRTLYWRGDAHERRAVLRALPYLPIPQDDPGLATALVEEALRTDDPRLVAAAMGPCARTLDDDRWRQGVLKCAALGLPLGPTVAGLDERGDAELGCRLAEFATARRAAGRSVPGDVGPTVARFAAHPIPVPAAVVTT
jgi:hypothetical protein